MEFTQKKDEFVVHVEVGGVQPSDLQAFARCDEKSRDPRGVDVDGGESLGFLQVSTS